MDFEVLQCGGAYQRQREDPFAWNALLASAGQRTKQTKSGKLKKMNEAQDGKSVKEMCLNVCDSQFKGSKDVWQEIHRK